MKVTALVAAIGVFGLTVVTSLVLGLTALSWHNTANGIYNQYEMKIVDQKNQFDGMWKKVKQAAQVPEQKKEAFKEIFNSYAGSRSGGGENQVMTWVKEAVPAVDLSIHDQLMNIITGSRDTWTMKQTELVSIAEQYNAMLVTQPKGLILGFFGHKKIDPKIITSTRTEETFASGKDDDVSL